MITDVVVYVSQWTRTRHDAVREIVARGCGSAGQLGGVNSGETGRARGSAPSLRSASCESKQEQGPTRHDSHAASPTQNPHTVAARPRTSHHPHDGRCTSDGVCVQENPRLVMTTNKRGGGRRGEETG